MHADFWLERWSDGRTHFHQPQVTALLRKHWPSLSLPPGSRVLVPLCGKSLDMIWLAEQGYRVLGVELSQLGVEQFFAENDLSPDIRSTASGAHYCAGNIEIVCGDIFKLDAATLSGCVGVYDRAALVALPADMRERYVRHVYAQLSGQYRGLLITLDYAQERMDGPPFSVPDREVQALYARHSEAVAIDRIDILDEEPKFAGRGLAALDTVVYRLQGKR
ncbi:MAG: thiopurine S-methyltransferase [Herbaspirillum sp.]|jgi:thiopurine S-methyltransferase|nr:thiopurine S-methyltransferase [Herbaspirillum sp.]